MVANQVIQNRVFYEKQKIEEQILHKIAQNQIKSMDLCSVEENIGLWLLQTVEGNVYFYTDLKGNFLFNGEFFLQASAFSNLCAWVQDLSRNWFIINIAKHERILMPTEDFNFFTMRGLVEGNLAIFDYSNHWGSYYFNSEEKTFKKDVPCIWDALEFSRKDDWAYVGISSSIGLMNSSLKWNLEEILLQLKIAKMNKSLIYNTKVYQKFLKEYLVNPTLGVTIKKNIKKIPDPLKEKHRIEFIQLPYDIRDGFYEENKNSLYNTNTNELVNTGNLENYEITRSRVIK